MGIFGWSLPPGCGTLPGEEDEGPCEVCGHAIDYCICKECQKCGTYGDPECYETHGMVRTRAQIEGRAKLDEMMRAQAERDAAEAAYWTDPQRKIEAEQFLADLARDVRESKL